MAHNTGWSKFAENFNSVYDVTSGAFQKYDINKIMKEKPQVTSKGLAEGPRNQYVTPYEATFLGNTYDKELTDDQKRKARNAKIADVYTKYGNTDKAAEMLAAASELEKNQAVIASSRAATAFNKENLRQSKGLYQGKINAQADVSAESKAQTEYYESQNKVTQQTLAETEDFNKIMVELSELSTDGTIKTDEERYQWALKKFQETGNEKLGEQVKFLGTVGFNSSIREGVNIMSSVKGAFRVGETKGMPLLEAIADDLNGDGMGIKIIKEEGRIGFVNTDTEGNEIPGSKFTAENWEKLYTVFTEVLDPATTIQLAATAELNHQSNVTNAVTTFMDSEAFTRFTGTPAEKSDMVDFYKHQLYPNKKNPDGTPRYPKPFSYWSPEEIEKERARIDKALAALNGDGGDADSVLPDTGLGHFGVVETQINKDGSTRQVKAQTRQAKMEIVNLVNAVYNELWKDLIPWTLDSNLSRTDREAQERRDKAVAWLKANKGVIIASNFGPSVVNAGYFGKKNNITKFEAFKKDPTTWILKQIAKEKIEEEKVKKGLK